MLTNKNTLVSHNELIQLTGKIIGRYVASGCIPKREEQDVQMSVIEKFIQKQETIAKNYSGQAKVTTYVIAVLNRMCCEIIRRDLKHWKTVSEFDQEYASTSAISSAKRTIINDEIQLLDRVLRFFGPDYLKVRVFCAVYFQLPLNRHDIDRYDPNHKFADWDSFTDFRDEINKGELFEWLAKIVNQMENKKVQADAVRMWLNKTIDTIITRLNGPFNRANYSKESFQLLFEYYYVNDKITTKDKKEGVLINTMILWAILFI